MPKVFVFNKFIAFDKLCQYIDCSIKKFEAPTTKQNNDAPDSLFQTNIKIFFDSKDVDDTEHAYRIKQTLEEHNIATFVTDQLTIKEKKDNGEMRTILLPKDRIVMKFVV